MVDSLDRLASFVPRRVLEHFASEPTASLAPRRECYPGALLFADIAGFVPIAARISALGPEGVERLSEVLNDYLGRLIQVVHDHGGDVVSFHGDALLAQ